MRVALLAAGLVLLAVGVWAFLGPRSFYDAVATYPPFNQHFIRDIGAFNLGLGAVLLLALVWSDAVLVVLAGNAVGAAVHAVSHVLDADVSGPVAPIGTTVFALAVAAAAIWRRAEIRR